jgi:hypothetical protein
LEMPKAHSWRARGNSSTSKVHGKVLLLGKHNLISSDHNMNAYFRWGPYFILCYQSMRLKLKITVTYEVQWIVKLKSRSFPRHFSLENSITNRGDE